MEWFLWNCMEFFYGIPWKMSKSFMENIDGEISMETGFLILSVLILHGDIFHGTHGMNSMEVFHKGSTVHDCLLFTVTYNRLQ